MYLKLSDNGQSNSIYQQFCIKSIKYKKLGV